VTGGFDDRQRIVTGNRPTMFALRSEGRAAARKQPPRNSPHNVGLQGGAYSSSSEGLWKRYPTHGSVRMYLGCAGSSSIFFRSALTYDLRYSSSSPYSGPHTVRSSLTCGSSAPWFLISRANKSNSVG
jgi:hypothetical protein